MAARFALLFAAAMGVGALGHAADPPTSAKASLTPPSIAAIGRNTYMVRDPLTLAFSDGAPAITVPAGFVTELSSVPKDLRAAVAPAVLHDYLYWYQPCSQEEADAVMYSAMAAVGVSRSTATAAVQAISSTGPATFKKYRELRRSGEVRTFTEAYAQNVVRSPNFTASETLESALRKAQSSAGLVKDELASPAVKLTCARLLYQCEACRDQVAGKKTPKARVAKGG
ncbi:MAG TPA: DUF1353 domain-containing protein [Burkholderiaceae bacterium]|nr:DUF1353 domain-containing protein [Burkholderiaceae bacterium]